jgi:hypothetical protein
MKKILSLIAVLLLAACENAPAGYTAEPITYTTPPIRVNVAEIKLIDSYRPPLRAPNVEQDFPTPPAVAVKAWAGQQLVATGNTGVLEVTIDNAAVKQVALPTTKGIKGLFTDDQDTRYDAALHVTFRLYDGVNAMSAASGDVLVTRSHTINEKATIDDRLRLFDQMTHEMMATFDQQAHARFQQYFAAYVK